MIQRSLILAVWLASCGSPETPPVETAAEVHAASDAPTASEPVTTTPPTLLDTLFATLERGAADQAAPLPTPTESVAACPGRADEGCVLASTAAFDPNAGKWLVLEVDQGPEGPEAVSLRSADARDERVLLEGDVGSRLSNLRRVLRRYAALPASTNLAVRRATTDYSLATYAPLVALAAPLDRWVLFLETSDLDTRSHRLQLIARDRSRTIELGTRPATVGACDGDGWTCRADPSGQRCAEEDLRAENRLCVQPLGIERVAIAPDGSTLLVQGSVQVAGHGATPPFHWIVTLPDDVRPPVDASAD